MDYVTYLFLLDMIKELIESVIKEAREALKKSFHYCSGNEDTGKVENCLGTCAHSISKFLSLQIAFYMHLCCCMYPFGSLSAVCQNCKY